MSILCPVCAANIPSEQTACHQCGAELSTYLSVYYAPDLLYNEAAVLMEEKDYRTAYDKLAAAYYLRPLDLEILLAMSNCAECMGDYLNAMEKTALAMVDSKEPSLTQNYERLNGLLSAQQQRESIEHEQISKIYEELKVLISKASREAIHDLMLAAAKQMEQQDAVS